MLGQFHGVVLLRRPKAPGDQQGAEVNARLAERIVQRYRIPVVDAQLQRRGCNHVLRALKVKLGVPSRLQSLHDRLAGESLLFRTLSERELYERVRQSILVGCLEPLAAQQVHAQLSSYLLWLLSRPPDLFFIDGVSLLLALRLPTEAKAHRALLRQLDFLRVL
eukprot:scaffold88540_cov61-Phaeocystis_antarctica.AAC.6